jgi:hypothetical protein
MTGFSAGVHHTTIFHPILKWSVDASYCCPIFCKRMTNVAKVKIEG